MLPQTQQMIESQFAFCSASHGGCIRTSGCAEARSVTSRQTSSLILSRLSSGTVFVMHCSSTDSMQVTSSGMYTSAFLDLCAGNSGGAVVHAASTNLLVAVVSGESTNNGACVNNLFAPSLLDQNVNDGTNTCTRSTGGVSIPCLSRQLPA